MLKRTSGGDNDTELNELTVAPMRLPSFVTVVTTATPVGKSPRASRKLRSVKVIWRGPICGKQTRRCLSTCLVSASACGSVQTVGGLWDTYLRHCRPMAASSLTGPILLDGAKSAAGYVALGVDAQVHLQQIADELIE
jgi:hypothetical protein